MTEAELAAIGAAILATEGVHSIVGKMMTRNISMMQEINLGLLATSGQQFLADLEALLRSEKEAIGNGEAYDKSTRIHQDHAAQSH